MEIINLADNITQNYETTHLYPLIPLGLNTIYVESLTGYIARLAEAHCITTGTLVNKLIVPSLNKEYLSNGKSKGSSTLFNRSRAINGVGEFADGFLNQISDLTLRSDLKDLTLLAWKDYLIPLELFHPTRMWCPICYQSWYEKGEVLYEPLVWYINEVTVCPKHLVRLQSICPWCGKDNLIMAPYSRAGYCSKCRNWLGMKSNKLIIENETIEELNWQFSVIKSIEDIFLYNNTGRKEDVDNVAKNISNIIDKSFNGNLSAFSKVIDEPKSKVWGWKNNYNKPPIKGLLKICYFTGISLIDIFSDQKELLISQDNILDLPKRTKAVRFGIYDSRLVEEKLDEILKAKKNPPPSMKEVATNLGCNIRLIYRDFPDKCKKIAARYIKYRSQISQIRIKKVCKDIISATKSLNNKGVYPSRRNIEAEVGLKGVLKEKAAKEAWKSALCNIK